MSRHPSARMSPWQACRKPRPGFNSRGGHRRAPGMTDLGLKTVKIFADGADLEAILELADRPDIAGFTTNPTLMRQSGVTDYEGFARKLLEHRSEERRVGKE